MTNQRALIVLISAAAVIGIGMGIRQASGLFLYPITADLSVGLERIDTMMRKILG